MIAGSIDLDGDCIFETHRTKDVLNFRPSCTGYGCSAYFGYHDSVPAGDFHLTDAEIDRITSEGAIFFGDNNTTDVNSVEINGVTYHSGDNYVVFKANVQDVSLILFKFYLEQ